VVTRKGAGYAPAEAGSPTKWHAPGLFNKETGEILKGGDGTPKPPKFQDVFGHSIIELAKADRRIVGVTPAMPSGCSLKFMMEEMPDRAFDVGIAEQHAVTMAAGMACEGLRPVCAIYSTFLQRAYDQLIHDVGIQNLPVTFVMDRAGIVGADGPTHQGQYDISYLRCVPNFTVMAPKDEAELQRMLVTSIHHDGPCALRIPRGEGEGVPLMEEGWEPLQIGRGELLTDGDDLLIVAYGSMVAPAIATAGLLQERGVRAAVINARFLRPLDEALILPMARRIGRVVTMEEGCLAGGFGAAVVETMNDHDVLVPVLRIGIPDQLVDHATPDQSKQSLGLTPPQMSERILERFGADLRAAQPAAAATPVTA
jgi:1-deoxy-D-xylulose-5-phosphate synthase